LYGSESELEESGDETSAANSSKSSKKKSQEHGARLRLDNDEPMDLLQGVASRITNASSKQRRKPGQDATHFKMDDDTGKMIIDGDDSSGDEAAVQSEDVVGTAYKEALTSVDGFTRGLNGRIKFNKDTKKRRREAEETEDVEMADREEAPAKPTKGKRQAEPKLGHEFKAKKAGGDVKKKRDGPVRLCIFVPSRKKIGAWWSK